MSRPPEPDFPAPPPLPDARPPSAATATRPVIHDNTPLSLLCAAPRRQAAAAQSRPAGSLLRWETVARFPAPLQHVLSTQDALSAHPSCHTGFVAPQCRPRPRLNQLAFSRAWSTVPCPPFARPHSKTSCLHVLSPPGARSGVVAPRARAEPSTDRLPSIAPAKAPPALPFAFDEVAGALKMAGASTLVAAARLPAGPTPRHTWPAPVAKGLIRRAAPCLSDLHSPLLRWPRNCPAG